MPTFGTPVLVDANGDKPLAIAKLSSTLSIAAYDDTGTTDLRAVTVTVGATPVVNTSVQVENITSSRVVLVGLTSTSAMILYSGTSNDIKTRILTVSGTTITVNSATTLAATIINSESLSACFVTTTSVLAAYESTRGECVILSVSGTTITENTPAVFFNSSDMDITNCASFTSTKAFVNYNVSSTSRPWGSTITISGTTVTPGTAKIIEALTTSNESEDTATIQMSATKIIAMACGVGATDLAYFWVITLNGTTFDIGTRFDLVADNGSGIGNGILSAALITATSFLVVYKEKNVDNLKLSQLDITGGGSDELTETGTAGTLAISSVLVAKAAPVDSTTVIIHYAESSSDVVLGSVETTLGLAAMTKPADVDASGTFIYVALLEDGSPILTKISTALNADGTTVFDPGAGDNIGVECGRFNADVVWVGGNFDGTNVVEKSEDAGSSFVVKDDATIGDVRAFVMGPDSDDKILLFDETNGDILETRDDGASWISINAAVTPEVNAIARLGKNVQESVFGNQGAANDNVNYSINSGDDLEDFNLPVNQDVTRVIIN